LPYILKTTPSTSGEPLLALMPQMSLDRSSRIGAAALTSESTCTSAQDRLVEGGVCRIIHGIAILRPGIAYALPEFQTACRANVNAPRYPLIRLGKNSPGRRGAATTNTGAGALRMLKRQTADCSLGLSLYLGLAGVISTPPGFKEAHARLVS